MPRLTAAQRAAVRAASPMWDVPEHAAPRATQRRMVAALGKFLADGGTRARPNPATRDPPRASTGAASTGAASTGAASTGEGASRRTRLPRPALVTVACSSGDGFTPPDAAPFLLDAVLGALAEAFARRPGGAGARGTGLDVVVEDDMPEATARALETVLSRWKARPAGVGY
jgi:hypothetical protein